MNIRFNRAAMQAAFSTAAAIAPTRSPKPILQQVLLAVADGVATLSATNLEQSVVVQLDGVEADEDGQAMLPVDRFGMILRESTDEEMTLTTSARGTEVRGSRNRFKLAGQSPDEFPRIARFDAAAYCAVGSRRLGDMIRRTIFAADEESSRYALGGVRLEFERDQLFAIASDGRTLARMVVDGESVGDIPDAVIVPVRALQTIARSLPDDESEVRIAASENDVLVRPPAAEYSSRLVEGRFPDWRKVLPDEPTGERVQLVVGPMLAAVRQAAIAASNESRGVTFTFGDGALVLSAATADVGEARVELPIEYAGPRLTVRLDHRFVADFLRVLPAEMTVEAFVGDDAPIVFRTEDGYAYIVMPMAGD